MSKQVYASYLLINQCYCTCIYFLEIRGTFSIHPFLLGMFFFSFFLGHPPTISSHLDVSECTLARVASELLSHLTSRQSRDLYQLGDQRSSDSKS